MRKFAVRDCEDFGYIVDALHFLKTPRRPRWIRLLDEILARVIYWGFMAVVLYLAVLLFVITDG